MKKLSIIFSLLFAASAATHAQNFSLTSLSVLATNKAKSDPILGTGTADENLTTYQLEHFSDFKYGDIYLDAELFDGDDVAGQTAGSFGVGTQSQSLFVVNPRLSFSKMTGKNFAAGPIVDVSLIARWERATYADFKSKNYGLALNLNVPGFMYFETGLLRRSTNFNEPTWLWRSYIASKPFKIAGQNVHFDMLSLVNDTDHNGTEYFTRPQLLMDIDQSGTLQLGLRIETHHYDIAKDGYERVSPNVVIKWVL